MLSAVDLENGISSVTESLGKTENVLIGSKLPTPASSAPAGFESDVQRVISYSSMYGSTRVAPDVPDGGYGWVVVSALVGMNAVSWGKFRIIRREPYTERLSLGIRHKFCLWHLYCLLPAACRF